MALYPAPSYPSPIAQQRYPRTPGLPPRLPGPVGVPAGQPIRSGDIPPTFQPPWTGINPTQAISSQPDPRIARLLQELSQQASDPASAASAVTLARLRAPVEVAPPDFTGVQAQSEKLQALIRELMAGRGPETGPVAADPEAVAYRAAAQRSGERQREAEAARQGATGTTGSGDFDARLAQIREATGEDIAGFEGALTGRRRQEATSTALSGANLERSELERQTQAERDRYQARLGAAHLARQGELAAAELEASQRAGGVASRQALLQTLLGEQARVQGGATETAFRTEDLRREEQMRALEEELRQQEVARGKREAENYKPPRVTPSGGFRIPGR